jgi:hypothetical protein
MVPLSALGEAWAAFFHAPASATTIASFRILFGGILLVNAAGLARDLAFLYGPRGAVAEANRAGLFGRERWSLLRWGGDHEAWLRACLAIHSVAAVSLSVGACTRASAAVVCATLMTIQSRNPLVNYGGDDVLRVMSFLLIFAPAGHSLSVDSWLGSGWWVSREPIDPWCWRLMQLQVSILYFKAFAAKLAGESWRDGRAVYLATEVEDFRRRRLPAWARRPAWCRLGAGARHRTRSPRAARRAAGRRRSCACRSPVRARDGAPRSWSGCGSLVASRRSGSRSRSMGATGVG